MWLIFGVVSLVTMAVFVVASWFYFLLLLLLLLPDRFDAAKL
jgi:hypothetical protein